jgi:hypothetical protein
MTDEPLKLKVYIDASLESEVQGVVAFGDFTLKDDLGVVYPDLGVAAFYEDLYLGRPFPLVFVTRGVHTIGKLVAISLFLHRDLAIHPGTPGLVTAASFVDRHKLVGLAHIDRDLGRFFKFLETYLPASLSRDEQHERLGTAVDWIRQHVLEGTLPAMPPEPELPKILDVGTSGFVLAEASGSLEDGWIELYRQGFLRGALFSPPHNDRRGVLVARKSLFLAFDLPRAASILNEAEGAMGESQRWIPSELWLRGPDGGTLLPISAVTDILVRV